MDCRQWDAFVRIPIKGDPKMDAMRRACVELESEEIMEKDGRLYHKPEAKAKLEKILSESVSKKPSIYVLARRRAINPIIAIWIIASLCAVLRS